MDRLGDSAKKGFDFIKSRAKETMEVQKLSSSIKQIEERRQQCLLDLGHRVLATYQTEELTSETFRDRVEEIRDLEAQLQQKSSDYQGLKKHLRQSVGDLLPGKSNPSESDASTTEAAPSTPIPAPDYEEL